MRVPRFVVIAILALIFACFLIHAFNDAMWTLQHWLFPRHYGYGGYYHHYRSFWHSRY